MMYLGVKISLAEGTLKGYKNATIGEVCLRHGCSSVRAFFYACNLFSEPELHALFLSLGCLCVRPGASRPLTAPELKSIKTPYFKKCVRSVVALMQPRFFYTQNEKDYSENVRPVAGLRVLSCVLWTLSHAGK